MRRAFLEANALVSEVYTARLLSCNFWEQEMDGYFTRVKRWLRIRLKKHKGKTVNGWVWELQEAAICEAIIRNRLEFWKLSSSEGRNSKHWLRFMAAQLVFCDVGAFRNVGVMYAQLLAKADDQMIAREQGVQAERRERATQLLVAIGPDCVNAMVNAIQRDIDALRGNHRDMIEKLRTENLDIVHPIAHACESLIGALEEMRSKAIKAVALLTEVSHRADYGIGTAAARALKSIRQEPES